jgi:hypothetical protein
MLRHLSFASVLLPVLCLLLLLNAGAQTPVALPYTMTTYAGLSPMSATTGTQCPNLPVGVVSTDKYGDGCLAVNAVLGATVYGGTLVDQQGNLYIVDETNLVVHKINPATGIMTLVAGNGTTCSGKQDSVGDGCLAATGTVLVNNRSANIDFYGNILLGGYADHLVHMICLNASPLCVSGTPSPTTANPLQIQIGYMGIVAGCAANTGSSGTTGTGAENTPGFSYKTYSVSAFQNSGSCTTSLGEVNKPEGITTDVYGNVYYADSAASRWRVVLGPQTYNGVTNPLYAILVKNTAWTTVTAGYVYTISAYPSTIATTKGSSCNGGGTATDTYGDGCLFTSSYGMGVSSYPTGMGVDAAGNMIYTDLNRGLRVFYVSDGTNFASGTAGYIAGQRMKNVIVTNNSTYVTTPVTGFNYMLAGGGSTAIGSSTGATPAYNLSFDNKMFKLAVSPQGYVFIGDSLAPARIYFFDINTGYMRTLFTGSANVTAGNYCNGSSGAVSQSKYSDGCPASLSLFTNTSSMSVGVDPQGNLYMYDTSSASTGLVRKVLAQGFSPQTISTSGTALTQSFQVHLPESATGTVSGATATVSSSPDITAASGTNPTTPSCSQNSDNTVDCTVTVTTTPSVIGQQSAALTVALPSGSWQNASATINLEQTVTGSVLAVDGAAMGGTSDALTTNALLSGKTPASVALDGAGNLYEASGTSILELASGVTSTLTSSLSVTPSQIAVDPTGNIFAVNNGIPTITELAVTAAGAPSTYTTTSVAYTSSGSTAAPQAIATDQFGNLYVADYQSNGSSVYKLSLSPLTQQYQNQLTVASGFENPVSLAVDVSGNVFVADKGVGAVYEYTPESPTSYSLANTLTITSPEAVAVDVAGDLYVQAASAVTEYPVSGPTTVGVTVLTGLSIPVGLAVDGVGNVYSADAGNTSITQVVRDATTADFGTSETTAFTATLTNVGNQVTTGSNVMGNVELSAGSGTTPCTVSNNELGVMNAGQACTISAEMMGAYSTTSSGPLSDTLTYTPAVSSLGSLSFTGTLPVGQVYTTTTTITGPAETTPTYSATGTEATFTVTVDATVPPTNTVAVTVDSTTTNYSLNSSGVATVTVTGLAAGTHTISAVYTVNGFYLGSSAAAQSFTIAQASTSVSAWTPGVTTQQVSQAIGTSVLDAVASTTDTSVTSIAGNFVYTALCTSTDMDCQSKYASAAVIDASTYLPIGTYTLSTTFVPTDTTNYATNSTAITVTGYTVTQASTTAVVGASTNVVASDGSGNYTNLSDALAALPVTGGSIYLKPGTYSGQNAISYPNVFLRGLGGDPTAIILTGANGAFTVGSIPTGFTAGPAGKGGDEGSAILDVSKNGYMGTTAVSGSYTPYGFYADYLTIQNTYNTDTTLTSTTTASGNAGSCSTGSTSYTLQYLFNNNMECGSQALAMWISTDQAILNNVYLTSKQDTLYAGYQGTSGSNYVPARQYIWKGMITGDVDYIFGDAALVLDHTNIFTTWHGTTATGTETIEAQNKRVATGGSNDYLSGYICNACNLMSQSSTASGGAMTKLYYGRPYGTYSTFVLLNSLVDQVNPSGWIGWDGASEYLSTSTYAEYNTQALSDSATTSYPTSALGGQMTTGTTTECSGSMAYNYICGGNTGYGVLSTSTPSAARESYALQLTAAQAVPYYPINFLSSTVSTTGGYTGMPTTWNPVTALAKAVNAFASTGTSLSVASGTSVTLLVRPQTPGAGMIPSGTYTLYDGSTALVTNGILDASGEAYYTTSALSAGTHLITMNYGGDSNFAGSTSATPFVLNVTNGSTVSPSISITASSVTYGSSASVTVMVTSASGSTVPSGTVMLTVDGESVQTGTLTSTGACSFTLSSLTAGAHTLSAIFEGDSNFLGGTATGTITVNRAALQVVANNATMVVGGTLPSFTYTISGYVNSETSSVLSGTPALNTSATGSVVGEYPITITTGTLSASNYTFIFTDGILYVTGTSQATSVATGDTRTVAEPVFPTVCQQLTAGITMVDNDIPDAIDNPDTTTGASTNPDGARIQAALDACSATAVAADTNLAVQLSVDGAGHDAFLTGPLTMPSNVTLLVDPAVVVFFSRNVQDYDKVTGTHTCGTISTATATKSCQPLIDIPKGSTNVGIMGYGKLDGRGGDELINAIDPYEGYSWWDLSAAYSGSNSQQNPRWIQMESGSSNITLYKITLRNAPLFHVATGGAVTGFTAWDVKIVTPTSARNTDGIDPGNLINGTITRSWISDGDDNVAIGGAGTTAPAENISVTNNHFFAGHGESIGSYTGAGVSNILWDGNMSAGNAFANVGSASITGTADTNSTGIRIKSANDRGGLVTGIQYSNSCFLDHKADIQFTPLYNTNTGTLTPNFTNILLQNLVFVNDYTTASTGTVQFTGADNAGVSPEIINPLQVTLDNVTFPSALSSSNFVTTGTAGTETNAQLTYGPGQVSTNFVTAWASFAGSNGNTVTDNRTATSLLPPTCNFTYVAPELTGPSGLPQTITYGQNASVFVILTPAVGGAAYPTGTVTLTDALTGSTYSGTLSGSSDTLTIPLSGLIVGTHTFTVAYYGDTNYVPTVTGSAYTTAGPYVITVNAAATSLSSTSTALSLSSSTVSYGTSVTATATVTGSSPTGSVQFVVSGGGSTGIYTYSTVNLSSGTATTSINLPYSTTAYSITAIYSGDAVNAGSTSSSVSLTVGAAVTTTSLSASATSVAQGQPVTLTASVASVAGTPTSGTVTFTYSTTSGGTQITMGTAALSSGVTTFFTNSLSIGTAYVTATYAGSGSYGGSTSASMQITVTAASINALSSNPIPLPYTITTIAGGGAAVTSSTMACSGATNKYGDGCLGTAIAFTSGDDMRSVAADHFGNVYLSDISATRVRRIAPNGIITTFAGGGSTCTPPASTGTTGTGCTPTLSALSKARGVSTDLVGNVFIADYSSDKVFEVKAADGLMYLVAGTGTASSTGDGGLATSATVYAPRGAAADTLGNIYIADTSGNRIRVVDTTGYIHAFAGTGTNSSTGDGAAATAATISNPQGVMTDANLNVYIADGGGRIRVVCVTCGTSSPLDYLLQTLGVTTTLNSATNGFIYTIAGNGSSTASTSTYTAPVLSTTVPMSPQKLAMDNSGNFYISDGNGFIWFLDFRTGYLRAIASNASTVCSNATNTIGDGCPATQSSFGTGSSGGLGVGTDAMGNIYISDSTNRRIRKVITGLQTPSTTTAATTTLPVELHFIPGETLAVSNGLSITSSEWTLGTASCTTNTDTTADCLFTSGFEPAVPGLRSTPLTVSSSLGNTFYFGLSGLGLGAGATLDPASQISFGTNLSVTGLATDSVGNVYVSDANSKSVLRFASSAQTGGTSAAFTTLATLTAPGALAVDQRGYVYAADTSAGTITQISPAGVAKVFASGFTAPAGLTVDAQNNIYLSDSSTKAVYLYSGLTGVSKTLSLGTLVTPKGLAIDPSGNLLIADPGAPALYRYNFVTNTRSTVTTSATAPSAVVSDAADDLLIADSAAILAVPSSSNSASFTIASLTPSALAIGPAGDLYTGSGNSIFKLIRTQGYVSYSTSNAAQVVSLLDSGNQALALTSVNQSDTTDFNLVATASSDCTLSDSLPSALAVGGVCSLTATYTPTTYLTTTNTVALNGNYANATLSLPASVELVLTGTVNRTASTAVVSSSNSAVMLQTAVTFTASVTSTAGTPTGSVTFLDGTTSLGTVQLSAGTAQLTTSSLTSGSHSITVSYGGDTNYLPTVSSAITESVVDFTLSARSSSLTVIPGKAGQFILTLSPVSPATTMPAAITFSVSGLPSGATYTLTPGSLASGAVSTTITLNIQTALATSAIKPGTSRIFALRLAPLSLAFLLLPFIGKVRKAGKRFSRMLSILLLMGTGLAAMIGLGGCGSGGYFGQTQKSYTVTVTATSGTLSHSTNVTLTVE